MRKTGRFVNLIWSLILVLLLVGVTDSKAQEIKAPHLSRQNLTFTLLDNTGKPVTEEAIRTGDVKIYSLRDMTAASFPNLVFDKESSYFTFSEPVISPGIVLAFVTPTETMYLTVYGRLGENRTIDGIKLQKGSYILTSNDFSGQKQLKVEDWEKFLEDDTPPAKQDLSSYEATLKSKNPISISKPGN